ncbi:hypothetical protein [Chondromyces crocatus]|uniref:hypothetical protein n=1 Tax=Chondromyces crocatus TaxID=52 RepID=UPI00067C97DC|nr:hypothetical protein [Chondromyces crocatus]
MRQPAYWLVFFALPAVFAFAGIRSMAADASDAGEDGSSPLPSPELLPPLESPRSEALPHRSAARAPSELVPHAGAKEAAPAQDEELLCAWPARDAAGEATPAPSLVPSPIAPFPAASAAPSSARVAPRSSGTMVAPRAPLPEPLLALQSDPDPPDCEPTPLTPFELAEVLREGHIRHFGKAPQADRWACAWAHCAFEQNRGGAIYGNNLGHLTLPSPPPGAPARSPGRVCVRRMSERLVKRPDRWARVDMQFRVFESPAEGAEAYWRLLANSYYSVLARCDVADPRGAAQRLAEIGYFTGPEQPYIEGMARLFLRARATLIPQVMAKSPLPATEPTSGR